MIKVYGRDDCKDCIAFKAAFDEAGIEYDFRDIGKSLEDMAIFLKIRDVNETFDDVVGNGKIGIPAIVLDDESVILDWEGYLKENN